MCFPSKPGHGQFNVNIPLYFSQFRRKSQYLNTYFREVFGKIFVRVQAAGKLAV
ncbi:hypothetical protein CLOSTASPAR_02190 [[Clostridium] asparagiforme DSM 15981]|uniref:Uncharacterized protein n=1 Tax=[Clostridium] asparagiforme DSM 15981 TaxID=518636 RepID=C0CYW3_9FIRM|nr:hypothetical protein CLOSTASPAR_02190 [[Clostridium] asparagiforme DSM 15981]